MPTRKKKQQIEFGDFQTPQRLAEAVCQLLVALQIEPSTLIEPTCGLGNFVLSGLQHFPTVTHAYASEINPLYLQTLRKRLTAHPSEADVNIVDADFFATDWHEVTYSLKAPILFIGNPPWVTNSELATMSSSNLPIKHNFQNLTGIEALTGASNFDISEWMILKMVDVVHSRNGVIAMLCKTSVARRVLTHIWKNEQFYGTSKLFRFDAKKQFDVNVDACLFVYDASQSVRAATCEVFSSLSLNSLVSTYGYDDQQLIGNVPLFKRWRHLQSTYKENVYIWRSGIKHDCARVMELRKDNGLYVNRAGEMCELEETYLYPMLKSSDLAGKSARHNLWMLVTQHKVGDLTHPIKYIAPKTWEYLSVYSRLLDKRKSSIYKGRPRFSIFGVGEYSFKMWKVAISGLYKSLKFQVVAPQNDKPTVLDDTCYFLACESKDEATLLAEMLNSEPAQQFWQSLIFWDAKRPVTAKLLRKLDIRALAKELGQLDALIDFRKRSGTTYQGVQQLRLLEQRAEYAAS